MRRFSGILLRAVSACILFLYKSVKRVFCVPPMDEQASFAERGYALCLDLAFLGGAAMLVAMLFICLLVAFGGAA